MAGTAAGAAKRWRSGPGAGTGKPAQHMGAILQMLQDEPGKYTEKALARITGLAKGSVLAVLNRIEQQGISLIQDPETEGLSIYQDYGEK